jgi:hypothetical protein
MTVLFDYQSQHINYEEWIDLITLCLTPLIAHIIAGVPSPTILQPKQPGWHDRIGLFNPTSIMWRYFAILDRRVRAKSWSALAMAASNAVFWTRQGWDGSEDMIWKSSANCLRQPSKTHIDIISGTAAKTLVIGLQGFSAIYAFLLGIIRPKSYKYADLVSISYVFVPLTIFGLFRLPIAFWLSDDYSFANFNSLNGKSTKMETLSSKRPAAHARSISTESPLEAETSTPSGEGEGETFYPTNSWRGFLVRTIFMGILVLLWGITLFYMTPLNGRIYTTTTLFINVFYFMWLSTAITIMGTYFWQGNSATTIIPCVSTTWYKMYTVFLLLLIIGIMVVAGFETRKTPCGKYTTYPVSHDGKLCPKVST